MKIDIKCRHCNRFLANATKSATMELKCSNSKCKKLDTYNVVFMSDLYRSQSTYHIEHDANDQEQYLAKIVELENKLSELDGRTKEAKELKSQIDDLQNYISQLEGIIDGQG